ncbi:hypothetical protein pb186bvf_006036 [Paramecium bursaria]
MKTTFSKELKPPQRIITEHFQPNFIDHNKRRKSSESQIEGFYSKKPKLLLETGGFLTNFTRWKVKRALRKFINIMRFVYRVLKLYMRRHTLRKNLRLRQSLLKCKTHFLSPKASNNKQNINKGELVQTSIIPIELPEVGKSFKSYNAISPEQTINLPSVKLTPKEKFSFLAKLGINTPKTNKINQKQNSFDRQSLAYLMSKDSINITSPLSQNNSRSLFSRATLNYIIYSPRRQLRMKK